MLGKIEGHAYLFIKENKTSISLWFTVGFMVSEGCVSLTVMAWCPGVFLGNASHFPLDLLGPISYS